MEVARELHPTGEKTPTPGWSRPISRERVFSGKVIQGTKNYE